MNRKRTLLVAAAVAGLLVYGYTGVYAKDDPSPIKQAMKLAEQKDYVGAESVLRKQLKATPEDADVESTMAMVQLWKNDYPAAQEIIDKLIAKYPENPDYLMLRANWHYYQGHLDEAEQDYAAITAKHPDYAEAQESLKTVQTQKSEREGKLWQLDAGYGLSSFAHSTQSYWHHEFLQLTRSFDEQKFLVHGRFERFNQYNIVNHYFEVGATRKFSDGLYADLDLGGATDALYKPRFRLHAAVTPRLTTADETYVSLWLPTSYQHDWYATTENQTFTVGPQIGIAEDWDANVKMVYTHQNDGGSTYGWSTQINGRFVPGVRFTTGYAFAPDLELSSITPVDTTFGGVMVDVTDDLTVRVDYAREYRDKSYTRNVIDASLSIKF